MLETFGSCEQLLVTRGSKLPRLQDHHGAEHRWQAGRGASVSPAIFVLGAAPTCDARSVPSWQSHLAECGPSGAQVLRGVRGQGACPHRQSGPPGCLQSSLRAKAGPTAPGSRGQPISCQVATKRLPGSTLCSQVRAMAV